MEQKNNIDLINNALSELEAAIIKFNTTVTDEAILALPCKMTVWNPAVVFRNNAKVAKKFIESFPDDMPTTFHPNPDVQVLISATDEEYEEMLEKTAVMKEEFESHIGATGFVDFKASEDIADVKFQLLKLYNDIKCYRYLLSYDKNYLYKICGIETT